MVPRLAPFPRILLLHVDGNAPHLHKGERSWSGRNRAPTHECTKTWEYPRVSHNAIGSVAVLCGAAAWWRQNMASRGRDIGGSATPRVLAPYLTWPMAIVSCKRFFSSVLWPEAIAVCFPEWGSGGGGGGRGAVLLCPCAGKWKAKILQFENKRVAQRLFTMKTPGLPGFSLLAS